MPGRITRRSAIELIGAGGFAGTMLGAGSSPAAAAPADPAGTMGAAPSSAPEPPAPAPEPAQIPAALRPGAQFGRWTIATVRPVERGVLHLDVRDRQGHEFSLELMARDPSPASRPPAEIGALAIYVCNGGDGWLPTVEEQGLAAMTLARLLDKHEQTGPIAGLLTHAQRVVAHGDILSAAFIPLPDRSPG